MSLSYSTYTELVRLLPDERSAHQYLASERWETGEIICPFEGCAHDQHYIFGDGIRYKCKKCKKKFTARTDTFMEGSPLPTVKWLAAMNYILHKTGISSVELAEQIGVTQKTAWFMGHRIRWALGFDQLLEDHLSGTIQADETFIGGKNKNRHRDKKVEKSQGRSHKDKTPVLGLLQTEESHVIERPHKVIPGRTVKEKVITKAAVFQAHVIKHTGKTEIQPIIDHSVVPGSIFVSDEWSAYEEVSKSFQHEIVDHGIKQYKNENGYSSNGCENRWSHLKPVLTAVHRQVSKKHLQKYVDQDTFRFNHRGLKIQDRIQAVWSAKGERLRYKDLIA